MESFNGWANRETWALALHIYNDEGWAEYAAGLVSRDCGCDAAEILRESVEDFLTPDGAVWEGGPMSVEASRIACEVGSLWRVDWAAVVESLRDVEVDA
jgi:hypothetical protein